MDRVLVSLAPGTETARVAAALRDLGATSASEPAPELPDVIVAEPPAGRSGEFCSAAARIPGVVAAEPEALSYTQQEDEGDSGDEYEPPPGWSSTEPE